MDQKNRLPGPALPVPNPNAMCFDEAVERSALANRSPLARTISNTTSLPNKGLAHVARRFAETALHEEVLDRRGREDHPLGMGVANEGLEGGAVRLEGVGPGIGSQHRALLLDQV